MAPFESLVVKWPPSESSFRCNCIWDKFSWLSANQIVVCPYKQMFNCISRDLLSYRGSIESKQCDWKNKNGLRGSTLVHFRCWFHTFFKFKYLGKMDGFVIAHALGWFCKTLMIRDFWMTNLLSVTFEFLEYSLGTSPHSSLDEILMVYMIRVPALGGRFWPYKFFSV